MSDFSKEIDIPYNKSEAIKKFIGVELTGNPELFPSEIKLPQSVLEIASEFIENNPLQEKSALIDYRANAENFYARKILKGGTYSPKKDSVYSTTIWSNFIGIQSRAIDG